ncbi:hypothetical protein GCM10011576_48510 [Micromonospora parathelypteridis]|nr:hypothetical protein GCM10011576_48510 [Micromonospora parathelypteridis]
MESIKRGSTDLGLYPDVTDGSDIAGHWFVDGLLQRAGGDPDRAAELAIAAVTQTRWRPRVTALHSHLTGVLDRVPVE